MRFSFLLLCAQPVILAFASSLSSNAWSSGSSVTHFTVYPIDPSHTVETTKTETLLKDLCGDTNVVPIQHDGDQQGQVTDSWRVTLTDSSDPTTAINALEGVRLVQKDNSPDTHPVRRKVDTTYIAMANSSFDWKKTEEFLKSKVKTGIKIYQITKWDDDSQVSGWSNLALDSQAKSAVEKHEGIRSVRVTTYLQQNRAIPAGNRSPFPQNIHQIHEKSSKLSERDGNWQKQKNADKALVMDSQYEGADLNKLSDFVYVSGPGKDTYVYVIDRGVRLEAVNPENAYEFHPPNGNPADITVLQTEQSVDLKEQPGEDDSPDKFHTTFIASKAVGTQFGLAKEATLISVKMTDNEDDFRHVFRLILGDLNAHPERQERSVVLIATGSIEHDTHDNVKGNPDYVDIYERPMQSLLAMGIPIVLAAGNQAQKPNRQNIDGRPMVYQSEDMPLINVGAANFEGERISMTQAGSQLTVYAPGENVEGMGKDDFKSVKPTGCSVAAPQVAGLIATYLSQDILRRQWDGKNGVARVRAIRDYLVSDFSSWVRKPGSGIRMIWNGAAKQDHDNAS